MGLRLWLPVANHQPSSSLDILLSPTLPSAHPSSSGCNHPSENSTSMESRGIGSCALTNPRGNYLSFTAAWLSNTASLSCFFKKGGKNLKLFLFSPYPFSPSEHKTKMRSPLSCDNFPWVKPIECYWAVSNLSGKVLKRYSGISGCSCLVACENLTADSSKHTCISPRLGHCFSHVNCKLSVPPPPGARLQRYANESYYAAGWRINVFCKRLKKANEDEVCQAAGVLGLF